MALKRSGVRASFAPSRHHNIPRFGRNIHLSALQSIGYSFSRPLLLALVCALSTVSSLARTQQLPLSGNVASPTDVFLFVHPLTSTTARIGLDYRKILPHAQVVRDIAKLVAVSGWTLAASPVVSDKSVRPDDPKRFPPTTGAIFSVANAPQFQDNAPALTPYLRAFQAWNRLEILFVTSDLQPYNGVTDFRRPELDVTLAKSEGIYSYLVTIREHSKALPPLIADAPPVSPKSSGNRNAPQTSAADPHDPVVAASANSPSLFLPYLFIILGSLLTGGVALYLLAKRRHANLKPGRLR